MENIENYKQMLRETPYANYQEHRDLIFMHCSFEDEYGEEEITFIVEKEYVVNYAKESYDIEPIDFQEWIKSEYTSDESEWILQDGILEGKVLTIYDNK